MQTLYDLSQQDTQNVQLTLSTTIYLSEVVNTVFSDRVVLHGYRFIARDKVDLEDIETHDPVLQAIGQIEELEVVLETKMFNGSNGNDTHDHLWTIGNEIDIVLYCSNKEATIHASGKNKKDVLKVLERIRKFYPEVPLNQETNVPVSLWSNSARGAQRRQRKLTPLVWDEVKDNYDEATAAQLDKLIKIQPPITGGRLLLWHGPPGTGKSSAIRVLMKEWLPWCDTSYVVDPEAFFADAGYMLKVVMDVKSSRSFEYEDEDGDYISHSALQRDKRWNLLIVEDADEFLVADAKDRSGQALSRLLNLSDGLLGQGLDFLILITTNEEVRNLHAAVSRPGRCLANVDFPALNLDQIRKWVGDDVKARKIIGALASTYGQRTRFTLAELYDVQKDVSLITNIGVQELPGQYL